MTAKKGSVIPKYPSVDAITNVLFKLKTTAEKKASVKQWAQALRIQLVLSALSDQNRHQPRGTRIALKELKEAEHHCFHFYRLLHEMPLEAQKALATEMGSRRLRSLRRGIGPVLDQLSRAVQIMEATPVTPGPRGPVQKKVVSEITRLAAHIYTDLTAKQPTLPSRGGKAYGPYLDFLTDLFEVLGVDASPEYQGKRSRQPSRAIAEKKGK